MKVQLQKTQPLLSVVIANYNYGRFLSDAIGSVLSQSCKDFELIICDGGSNDDSVEIIKKFTSKIAWSYSEPDGGQSAAFNKGFSHANGRFLTWLNADDVMLPRTIERLKLASLKYPECEWFVGGVFQVDPELRVFKCGRSRRMSKYRAECGVVNVCGPSSFFSRNLYKRVGKIDERFQYAMDTDLWLRFALCEHARYRVMARYAWGLRIHPDAKMSGHKFTSDGRILEGAASNEAYLKDKKRLRQLEKEKAWMLEHVRIRERSQLRYKLSADIFPAIMSRYDTYRFRGKLLSEIFP